MNPLKNTSPHRIEVQVSTHYLAEQSDPQSGRYVFAYTVTLKNHGELPAKLLSRHWVITDANGAVKEIQGSGVIGEYPYLRPGEVFEYSSGAVLNTPVGSMQGVYQMIAENGEEFFASVHPFRLAQPNILH